MWFVLTACWYSLWRSGQHLRCVCRVWREGRRVHGGLKVAGFVVTIPSLWFPNTKVVIATCILCVAHLLPLCLLASPPHPSSTERALMLKFTICLSLYSKVYIRFLHGNGQKCSAIQELVGWWCPLLCNVDRYVPKLIIIVLLRTVCCWQMRFCKWRFPHMWQELYLPCVHFVSILRRYSNFLTLIQICFGVMISGMFSCKCCTLHSAMCDQVSCHPGSRGLDTYDTRYILIDVM